MSQYASAAFLLPSTADVRAILYALAAIDCASNVACSIEQFTDADVIWVQCEGEDAIASCGTAMALLQAPPFNLIYTEV